MRHLEDKEGGIDLPMYASDPIALVKKYRKLENNEVLQDIIEGLQEAQMFEEDLDDTIKICMTLLDMLTYDDFRMDREFLKVYSKSIKK